MTLTEAVKEGIYLRQSLTELGFSHLVDGTIYCDNQEAKLLLENSRFHAKTKRIDIRHRFVRDAVQRKEVNVVHVPTKKMLDDIFTKPLATPSHVELSNGLGLST